jgi:rhamnose transport system substrate-binding protein
VSGVATAASSPRVVKATRPLEKGLKVFVIPKNLGNPYFTTSDSVKTGGALFALKQLREVGTETSGTSATPSSQIPAIEAAITKGANILIISATDPAALCPTLKGAMARGVTVVTYDSDAPACRDLFALQATSQGIGDIEVDIIAKEMGDAGQLAIVSAAPTAPNQNTWIGYMKQELKKYPKIQLVKIVYGMDDTATSTTVTEGLLTEYPNLKGIISPTTVGVAAAAAVLDTAKYRGIVHLTGLGLPSLMRKYVLDGTVPQFALWDPAYLGYLAAYAAVNFASGVITNAVGQTFTAGKLGKYTVAADQTVVLGPPFVFTKSNIAQFHF